jgi:hypothetical protein
MRPEAGDNKLTAAHHRKIRRRKIRWHRPHPLLSPAAI